MFTTNFSKILSIFIIRKITILLTLYNYDLDNIRIYSDCSLRAAVSLQPKKRARANLPSLKCFHQLYASSTHDGHKISRVINERLEVYRRMLQEIRMPDW